MQISDIEQRMLQLDITKGFDLIFDLLAAYGLPKASITRLKKGSYNKSQDPNELLWKNRVWYRYEQEHERGDLHALIDQAQNDAAITKQNPRFLIVRSKTRFLAIDTRSAETLDIAMQGLSAHSDFFMAWAGIEKAVLENINFADRKAAVKMAQLYDEVVKHNTIADDDDIHQLNVFFSRLLFCFFAENTGVFIDPNSPDGSGLFRNTLAERTNADGSDTAAFLDELFTVLDQPMHERAGVPDYLKTFGYVNGKLFASRHPNPSFSRKARRVLLECGQLNWSEINPDIFGSMIQAVVHPGQRESLGMHYTSVENIRKVIRPLFLEELETAFTKADTPGKLDRLLERISAIKFFETFMSSRIQTRANLVLAA